MHAKKRAHVVGEGLLNGSDCLGLLSRRAVSLSLKAIVRTDMRWNNCSVNDVQGFGTIEFRLDVGPRTHAGHN